MLRQSWGHTGRDGDGGGLESTHHVLKDTDMT